MSEDVVAKVQRAWDKLGIIPKCELCQCDVWEVQLDENRELIAQLPVSTNPESTGLEKIFRIYFLSCQKCGNTKLVARYRIDKINANE